MPANALIVGAVVTVLFILLTFISPKHNVRFGFITYPANTNVLVSLVSFGVSGIYLSFLMTVIAAAIARARGWIPQGAFRLGRWAWVVNVAAIAHLGLMFVNIVTSAGLASPRGYFKLDWITLAIAHLLGLKCDLEPEQAEDLRKYAKSTSPLDLVVHEVRRVRGPCRPSHVVQPGHRGARGRPELLRLRWLSRCGSSPARSAVAGKCGTSPGRARAGPARGRCPWPGLRPGGGCS